MFQILSSFSLFAAVAHTTDQFLSINYHRLDRILLQVRIYITTQKGNCIFLSSSSVTIEVAWSFRVDCFGQEDAKAWVQILFLSITIFMTFDK